MDENEQEYENEIAQYKDNEDQSMVLNAKRDLALYRAEKALKALGFSVEEFPNDSYDEFEASYFQTPLLVKFSF
ncbi:MAG: hypothetical protein NVS1B10_08980 [Candidatus Saccharimonadales bacterium]